MNAYKDVKQDLVEEIPGVRRRSGWKAPLDVRVAPSKDEAKAWAMEEPSRVALFLNGSLIDGKCEGNSQKDLQHYIWDIFHRRLRKTRDTHPRFRLQVDWTPGHVDIPGNKAADEAAKRAVRTGSFGGPLAVLMRLPFGKSALVLTYLRLLQKTAKKQFAKSPRYERINDIDPSTPSNKFRKLTAPLPRKHAALLFQLRSQYVPLAKHLHRLKKLPSATCPCCEEADETVEHFLHYCPAHRAARVALRSANRLARYTKHLLSDPALFPDVFAFIQRTGRFHAVYGDFKEVEHPNDDT
ncbi:hypothetical protein B0H15DRAFT_953255 [Mycena belliarum]|uniref:Reverse transcriptase zinc-binding domain-containing protein n=1 Tax=Mycena belliarum TaxID=1033014 RepID=A0AAD6TWN9_9AGAR|nr:hypothetical protein B0H15DRAFT_953255 [Mycena belliae]